MAETTTMGPMEAFVCEWYGGKFSETDGALLTFARQQDATLKALVEALEALSAEARELRHSKAGLNPYWVMSKVNAALKLAKGDA